MKLSEIYGKQVTLENGETGYIIKVYTDGERLTGALICDEHENELYLPTKSLRVKDGKLELTALKDGGPEGVVLALGRACYSLSGGYLGVLKEVLFRGARLTSAKIGVKKYAAENLTFGDVVIVKPSADALKHDVTKDGKVLFKRGETLGKKQIARAISLGEYVQTNLKRI